MSIEGGVKTFISELTKVCGFRCSEFGNFVITLIYPGYPCTMTLQ